jgi:sugar phosphate isomerase/epimerase
MTHFSLGVSLVFTQENLDEALIRELAAVGVKTFEINARQLTQPLQRDAARHLLARQRPKASSIHALFGPEYDFSKLEPEQWQNAVNCAVETVELAADLHIPILVMHASSEPVPPEERNRRLERVIEGFGIIGQKAKSTGRRIAIEYLPRTCLGNNLTELNMLVDRLGDETFGVCLDVNHLMEKYAELSQIVRSLGPRLIAAHISDCDEVDEKHWLPGRGVLNWPALMQSLREIDYKGPFTYECNLESDDLAEKLAMLHDNFTWLDNLGNQGDA